MGRIRVLELSGSPYEMGYAHGKAYASAIREFTEERIELSSDPNWTGYNLPREVIIALGESSLVEHERYAPELVEELRGMADATGLSLTELVIMNGFTDFIDTVYAHGKTLSFPAQSAQPIDDCTAFLVPDGATAEGHAFIGQTWDMHASSVDYVIMLRAKPDNHPAFMAFTTMGVLGLIGMNEAGIAVGINNLMSADGQPGVMYTFVVRKILQQTTLDGALEAITSAKLGGAHNYLIMDKTGRGYNVEAMANRYHITELTNESIVHTNHCLVASNLDVARERPEASQAASELRLSQGQTLLAGGPVSAESLMALTRDPTAICVRGQPPMYVETCGAAIMRPATRDFWAVWGLPDENVYEHYVI